MNSKYLIPAIGFTFLLVMMFVLLVVVMIRPWGGPDTSWATHLNLTDEPVDGFNRTVQTFVSAEGEANISVWGRSGCDDLHDYENGIGASSCDRDPAAEWAARGCAGCHGLAGQGSVVGPDLLEVDKERFLEQVRFGPAGMPAFTEHDLTDEHIVLIVEYLDGVRADEGITIPTPTVVPTATPRPVATAIPTVAPTVSTGTPFTPVPTMPAGGDDEVFLLGKKVFDETAGGVGCADCHGFDGKGEGSVPDIRGASRSRVRESLENAFDMREIDLGSDELLAVVEYLQFLNERD